MYQKKINSNAYLFLKLELLKKLLLYEIEATMFRYLNFDDQTLD